MSGFSITQESLLAVEDLLKKQKLAEGSTPQNYEKIIDGTEQAAIRERKEDAEEEQPPEGGDVDSATENIGDENAQTDQGQEAEASDTETSTDNPSTEKNEGEDKSSDDGEDAEDSDALADSIDSPTEQTMESVSEWIKDKTRYSDSAVIRNVGALAAGLAHLGITYGPNILNFMFKGMLWTFSRLGSVVFEGGKQIADHIERANNSIEKLEARLIAAEKKIITALNEGNQLPEFKFKNQKAIEFLKVGNNVDFTSNIRTFADSLDKASSSVANEFENGVSAIERISRMTNTKNVKDLSALMAVTPPRNGFIKGTIPGFINDDPSITQFRTDPLWPGDAALIFNCPNIKSSEISEISHAYGKSDMFVAVNKESLGSVTSTDSLSGAQAVVFIKSVKILLASMRQINRTQENIKKLHPKILLKAKQMFMDIADEKAKAKMKDSMVEPLYLRSTLASTVFTNGSIAMNTHASRVVAAAVTYIEAHASKIATSTE